MTTLSQDLHPELSDQKILRENFLERLLSNYATQLRDCGVKIHIALLWLIIKRDKFLGWISENFVYAEMVYETVKIAQKDTRGNPIPMEEEKPSVSRVTS